MQPIDPFEIQHWTFCASDTLPVSNSKPNKIATYRSKPSITLNQLHQKAAACQACALASVRKNVVFGTGDPNADLMLVGEAPGACEDKQGLPFVGQAGQLLTNMCLAINIDRKAVFIANILKCRPPRNRDPDPTEIEACEPFLKIQIKLIQPKVIVALGRYAAQTLLKTNRPLNRLRSQWHRYEACDLLVTYHPAYLLRNPLDKAKVWDDLCQLKSRLDMKDSRSLSI